MPGPEYLKKNAGKVATEEFVASHPVDIIERTLSAAQFASMRLGPVDKSTVTADDVAVYEAGSHAATVLPVGDKCASHPFDLPLSACRWRHLPIRLPIHLPC